MENETKPYYVLAFSGGKDSTYLLYEILQRKMPLDEISYLDTGEDFPLTYEWLDTIEKMWGVKITRYPPRPGYTFHEKFFRIVVKGKYKGQVKGFPWKCVRGCWIATYCKLRNRTGKPGEYTYVGLAANEAHRASVNAEKDRKIYPLIEWGIDEATIVKRLNELGIMPPYYKQGFTRGGCWLCPKQSLKALRLLWKLYPALWERLKWYQDRCPHPFRDDYSVQQLEDKFKKEEQEAAGQMKLI